MFKIRVMSVVTGERNTFQNDIVSLRLNHCRAEHAAKSDQYHLAVLHYRTCLESAECRQDCQAIEFFALKLASCYEMMGFHKKAEQFVNLAESCHSSRSFES